MSNEFCGNEIVTTFFPESDLRGYVASLGIMVENLICPNCHSVHYDINEWVFDPHQTHLCLHCGELFPGNGRGVSNPTVMIPGRGSVWQNTNTGKNYVVLGYVLDGSDDLLNNKNIMDYEILYRPVDSPIIKHYRRKLKDWYGYNRSGKIRFIQKEIINTVVL